MAQADLEKIGVLSETWGRGEMQRVRSETSLGEDDELANTAVRDWPRECQGPPVARRKDFPLVLFYSWSLILRALQHSDVYSNWTKGSGLRVFPAGEGSWTLEPALGINASRVWPPAI